MARFSFASMKLSQGQGHRHKHGHVHCAVLRGYVQCVPCDDPASKNP